MAENGIFDDRAAAYAVSGDIAAGIARQHHGLHIDTVTRERWRQLMSVMREVDTWADSGTVSTAEVLGELASYRLFGERYPLLSPGELGPETHRKLVARARTVLALGDMAAHTLSLPLFISYREGEADETVQAFGDVATDTVWSQPAFGAGFLITMSHLAQGATLWDSMIDGPKDFRTGRQRIEPDGNYYYRLLRQIGYHGKTNGRALLPPAPAMAILKKGGLRVVNRLRNGIPDYSTLRILR